MERIWGPFNGFWLAAYAAPTADGERFCSYAKVCWTRPDSYWDADCVFKIFGGERHRSLEGALGAVALDARNGITCLPRGARTLAGRRRREPPTLPRLLVTS
jgi:hypothetical protein